MGKNQEKTWKKSLTTDLMVISDVNCPLRIHNDDVLAGNGDLWTSISSDIEDSFFIKEMHVFWKWWW